MCGPAEVGAVAGGPVMGGVCGPPEAGRIGPSLVRWRGGADGGCCRRCGVGWAATPGGGPATGRGVAACCSTRWRGGIGGAAGTGGTADAGRVGPAGVGEGCGAQGDAGAGGPSVVGRIAARVARDSVGPESAERAPESIEVPVAEAGGPTYVCSTAALPSPR
ncbi:hypothetical protein [Micromonospora sp. NPDC049107]|uniref:hypothetical protein n=1 Tax=Micromonospora sp. NPDC049107 TaxID=3154349 RepID=UPI0033D7B985